MTIGAYILLISSVLIGGTLAFFFQQNYKSALKLVLSFSGAYLLGIAVLHLMPTIYVDDNQHTIGLWVLLGFFIQLILEQLSQGVEHGHVHVHSHSKMFSLQIMLGLCLHAFIEGMPLHGYSDLHVGHSHAHGSDHLLYGIILHKAPAAFALVLLLQVAKIKRNIIILYLIIFASMSPLGAGLAALLESRDLMNEAVLYKLLAVVVGSFLHIATTILFEVESDDHHSLSLQRIIVIALGIGAALLTLIAH